ncbi:methionyl-tRNA formyltransferase [bacterium]|nr:methionyl-tRNA formyltransferase [bacterium]
MKILFFGTTEFSCSMLSSIISAGHEIAGVVTLPDKPVSRGHKAVPTAVKKLAMEKDLLLFLPDNLKDESFAAELKNLNADIGVVVSFKILPRRVFTAPRLGTLNVHPSLLPKLRGPAPVRWALIEGCEETGVTTFLLDDKVDTGEIILSRSIPVGFDENYEELFSKVIPVASEVLLESLESVGSGHYKSFKQDSLLATKAPKLNTEICRINWNKSAYMLHNLIRGLSPTPGAWTELNEQRYKILKALPIEKSGKPGEIIECDAKTALVVACGKGALKILKIQAPGKKAMDCGSFLCGCKLKLGEVFA